jgi:hypothetical protein
MKVKPVKNTGYEFNELNDIILKKSIEIFLKF